RECTGLRGYGWNGLGRRGPDRGATRRTLCMPMHDKVHPLLCLREPVGTVMDKCHLHCTEIVVRSPYGEDKDRLLDRGMLKVGICHGLDWYLLCSYTRGLFILVGEKEPCVRQIGIEPELLNLDIRGVNQELFAGP